MLCLSFSRGENDEVLSSSFHKASLTLISKLCKDSIGRKKKKRKENYRQTSLENFDIKLLNKNANKLNLEISVKES